MSRTDPFAEALMSEMSTRRLMDQSLLIVVVACAALLVVGIVLKRRPWIRFGIVLIVVIILALQIAKHSQEKEWQRLTNIMFASHKARDKEEALRAAECLLDIARSRYAETHIRYAESVHHVGWLNWDLKRYTKAKRYFNESLRLYTEIERQGAVPPGLMGAGNEQSLLAGTHEALGEFEVAEQYYLQAIVYFQKRYPQHGWYLKSIMNNLAGLYLHLGRDAEASEWLARSAKLGNREQLRMALPLV